MGNSDASDNGSRLYVTNANLQKDIEHLQKGQSDQIDLLKGIDAKMHEMDKSFHAAIVRNRADLENVICDVEKLQDKSNRNDYIVAFLSFVASLGAIIYGGKG